ncbi:MAG: fabG [Methylobacterium brachiatum]|nr:fabG [Methylobacterium brachiatum]
MAACQSGSQMQDAVDTVKSEVSLGRFGQPVRVAPVYVFLASQEVRYVTGEVYGATGGNGSA